MNYELLIDDVREVSKDKLKEICMELDIRFTRALRNARTEISMFGMLCPGTYENLVELSKDKTAFEMLLINALKYD